MMPGPVTLLIFGYLHLLFTESLLLCLHAHSCLLLCLLPIASFSFCCLLTPSLPVSYCLLLFLLPIASFSACCLLPPSLPVAYCLLLCLLPIASFCACWLGCISVTSLYICCSLHHLLPIQYFSANLLVLNVLLLPPFLSFYLSSAS
jgi:hypothetical protein